MVLAMSFEELLAGLDETKLCKYGQWHNQQSQGLKAEIGMAFNRGIEPYKIYRTLTKMGLKCANSTFYRHHKGECICSLK